MNRRTFLSSMGCAMLMMGCATDKHHNIKTKKTALTTNECIELALLRFQQGYHCSQCVFEPYAAELGLSVGLARRMSAPLAGGTLTGGECGAIGSGYLVFGARFGSEEPMIPDREGHNRIMKMYGRIHRFVGRFKAKHGETTCQGLTGINVFSPEERQAGRKLGAFDNCDQYIVDAITLIDQLSI